ncbi:MAG: hypothetical protein JWM86_1658 [Thermoleophilia bacterium]|nr:hypothetical protein [Thermoleophilia bacterium]
MTETQRNFVILIGIALIGSLFFSDQFGLGTAAAGLVLNLLFTVVTVAFLIILYRRHQSTILRMPLAPRLVLQASGVTIIVLLTAGIIAFFVPQLGFLRLPQVFWPLLLLCGFGIWWAWQQRTVRW